MCKACRKKNEPGKGWYINLMTVSTVFRSIHRRQARKVTYDKGIPQMNPSLEKPEYTYM